MQLQCLNHIRIYTKEIFHPFTALCPVLKAKDHKLETIIAPESRKVSKLIVKEDNTTNIINIRLYIF